MAETVTGIDCIGKGYKDLLTALINTNVGKDTLIDVLANMPICEQPAAQLSPAGQEKQESTRVKAPNWDVKVDYMNEKGAVETFTSPSELARRLGLKMSGVQVCDSVKCKAVDVVDIFRLNGYLVECETEEGGKVITTLDCVKASQGGKAMHVIHPSAFNSCPAKKGKKSEGNEIQL